MRKTGLIGLSVALLALNVQPSQATPPTLPIFPPLQFHPPKPERWVMDNGLTVFFLEDHELPLVKADLMFRAGTEYDPADKVGLSSIYGDVLGSGGTLTQTPEVIETLLDRKAASVSFDVGLEVGNGHLSCKASDFDAVFNVFQDLVQHPLFRKDKLEISKAKALEELRRLNDEPEDLARREFRKVIYGPVHPYARMATPWSIDAIKRADLIAVHQRVMVPNRAYLSVSGDFKTAEMKEKLKKAFEAWPQGQAVLPDVPAPSTASVAGLYYIQRPINQTQIRIGLLGLARHNPDHFAWEVFNELWGASSSSLLFREVRTEQGLAYEVGSGFSEPAQRGIIVAVSQTRGPQAIAAVKSISAITKDVMGAPFSQTDIRTAEEAIRNRFVENYDSSAKIITQIMSQDYFGFPKDFMDTYTDHISAVTHEDLARVGKTYLHPDQFATLVVGDLSTFDKPISTLGHAQEIKPVDYADDPSTMQNAQ